MGRTNSCALSAAKSDSRCDKPNLDRGSCQIADFQRKADSYIGDAADLDLNNKICDLTGPVRTL